MSLAALAAVASAHMKGLAIVTVTTAATAGGGLAVASTVADPHSSSGRDTARAAIAEHAPSARTPKPSTSPNGKRSSAPAPNATTVCPEGLRNHGEYVSSVAHATPAASADPSAHGKAVSAAAHSDCGKKAKAQGHQAAEDQGKGKSKDHAKSAKPKKKPANSNKANDTD